MTYYMFATMDKRDDDGELLIEFTDEYANPLAVNNIAYKNLWTVLPPLCGLPRGASITGEGLGELFGALLGFPYWISRRSEWTDIIDDGVVIDYEAAINGWDSLMAFGVAKDDSRLQLHFVVLECDDINNAMKVADDVYAIEERMVRWADVNAAKLFDKTDQFDILLPEWQAAKRIMDQTVRGALFSANRNPYHYIEHVN